MVIDTQKFSLVTKLDFFDTFFSILGSFTEKIKIQEMTLLTLMVFVTQNFSLVTKIGNLSKVFPFWAALCIWPYLWNQ